MTDSLDVQDLRIFRFVRDYIRKHNMPPSQREIADATFMAATTMVIHLTRLEMQAWLYRDYNIPRSIRIGDNAPDDETFEAMWLAALAAEEEEGAN